MTERHVSSGRCYAEYGTAECHGCKQRHKQFIDVILCNDEFNLCIECARQLRDEMTAELERYDADKFDVDICFRGT